MNLSDSKNNNTNTGSTYFKKNKVFGFSLIEVVVTMAIFGIMMSISIFNYPRLSQALAFSTASENILDTLKSAQITGSSRGGDYRGDGIYFNKDNPFYYTEFLDATTTEVSLTGSDKSDKAYSNNLTPTPAKLDATSTEIKIQNNVKINDLCIKTGDTSPKECNKSKLSVVFSRPSLTANISDLSEFTPGVFNFYDKGYIELYINGSAGIDKKCLIIYKYGQMSLKQGPCLSQL